MFFCGTWKFYFKIFEHIKYLMKYFHIRESFSKGIIYVKRYVYYDPKNYLCLLVNSLSVII